MRKQHLFPRNVGADTTRYCSSPRFSRLAGGKSLYLSGWERCPSPSRCDEKPCLIPATEEYRRLQTDYVPQCMLHVEQCNSWKSGLFITTVQLPLVGTFFVFIQKWTNFVSTCREPCAPSLWTCAASDQEHFV